MKKSLLLSLALVIGLMAQAKVAFLVPAGDTDLTSLPYEQYVTTDEGISHSHEQSPERRAWLWFNEWYVASNMGRFICFNDLANIPSDIHAIWIYVDRVDFGTDAFDALFADYIDELQAFVNNGGHLLLAKQASRLEKDLIGATNAHNEVIVPDYNDGDYQGPATWGVDYRFEFPEEVVWSNAGHPIFKDAPFRDDNYAELIWTDGGMLTDHNCGISIGAMGMDSIKDVNGLTAFQNRNQCKVLGGWANGDGCHYGGVIEFYPTESRRGTVIIMGLAAYSWINNNAGNGWANTQAITRSTLRYLENLHPERDQYEIAYLLPSSILSLEGWYEGEQPEYNAAVWFRDTYVNDEKKGCFVTLDELPELYAKGVHTLWVNIERSMISPEDGVVVAFNDKVQSFVQSGGNVLLTKQATYLAYTMGRIGYAPVFESSDYTTEDRGAVRCIQAAMGQSECVVVDDRLDMSGHRIYNNMLSYWDSRSMFLVAPECKKTYSYCSWQDYLRATDEDTHYDNCLIQRLRDFEGDWHATVLASQGGIGDYCFSNIIEFNATEGWQGRILTIGSAAYQWGTSNNSVERQNLKTLTANCLDYLSDQPVVEQVYTRPVSESHFGTICFEYAVPATQIEGAEMYEIYSWDADADSVLLVKADHMEAGKPYIYYATGAEIRLRYIGMKEEAKRHNGLVGFVGWSETDTYEVEAGYYVVEEDALRAVDTQNPEVLMPRYAYVDTSEIPAYMEMPQLPYRKIAIIKTHPSAIDEVQKMPSTTKYLRNGVLYIERNGKKYSVLGCGL